VSDQGDSLPLRVEDLAETENFSAWRVEEPDGETTYHVEFGSVTLHFFQEEWDEALALFRMLLD
jgi:hypothetical protein